MKTPTAILDGNEAAADVAYRCSEVLAIYPITPATSMGELADQWNAAGRTNVWGDVPLVREMQSEGGVAGAIHGAVQTGALCATFTSSQGLLLMIPNLFKIAGELTPAVLHVASRAVGSHALTIYVEHSDVMATRQTGWAILFSSNVQEAHDLAAIAHAATLRARVPILHAFDGFRTSHEVAKVRTVPDEALLALLDPEAIAAHRRRALNPDRPVIRGTVHNSDVFFQFRERSAPYFAAAPGILRDTMRRFAELTGRSYDLFEYRGHPEAERVIVLMGSGAETAIETAEHLAFLGERVGVVKVRLFQPFDAAALVACLPPTVRSIAVLDRTKEHGAVGEPLHLAVAAGLLAATQDGLAPWSALPSIVGGRYGLGGKEFHPGMVKAVFDELAKDRPKNRFTVGIVDDVSGSSLPYDDGFAIEKPSVKRAVFWGLGSDGTVSANKNSIAIIGDSTAFHIQGYFLYDSRKSGSITESHLRFGPEPIRSAYLIREASFLGVHHLGIADVRPVLDRAAEGATVLLNTPFGPEETWNRLPLEFQERAIAKRVRLFGIDGSRVAREVGLGNRISAVMQTAFFALTDVLPHEEALRKVKAAVKKAYSKRGKAVVEQNLQAIDRAAAAIFEIPVPERPTTERRMPPPVTPDAPEFVQRFTAELIAGRGDRLPVSAASEDGTFPLGTTRYEKRNLSFEAPEWDPELCIQCGKCTLVCPHAVIRAKVLEPELAAAAPAGFRTTSAKWRELPGLLYSIQVSTDDCTGCGVCVDVCPAKDKSAAGRKALQLKPRTDVAAERERWRFFESLPYVPADDPRLRFNTLKNIQLLPPMFEFSGCCSGCGEAPYVKLMTQLFGDRLLIANAAGCSSVYSSNLPTTPYHTDAHGRGPAWCSSLFEDNAEFGYGMRLGVDQVARRARRILSALLPSVGERFQPLLAEDPASRPPLAEQRRLVAELRPLLRELGSDAALELESVADYLTDRSVWAIGGDGWAYDIGYGGLDHVVASGENVNLLVLDTEVYSNTGGQSSKATARGAVAKFTAGGKPTPKKDLGLMAMNYGTVYVAQVAMGANDVHTLRAFLEAESYDGPSLIIAYSHCIAHGIDMSRGMRQQRLAVESGHWPLYRYDPRRAAQGLNPFQLDSKPPSVPLEEYLYQENRYRILQQTHPEAAQRLLEAAKRDVARRWATYERLAAGPAPA